LYGRCRARMPVADVTVQYAHREEKNGDVYPYEGVRFGRRPSCLTCFVHARVGRRWSGVFHAAAVTGSVCPANGKTCMVAQCSSFRHPSENRRSGAARREQRTRFRHKEVRKCPVVVPGGRRATAVESARSAGTMPACPARGSEAQAVRMPAQRQQPPTGRQRDMKSRAAVEELRKRWGRVRETYVAGGE